MDFLIKTYFWVSPDSPGTHCKFFAEINNFMIAAYVSRTYIGGGSSSQSSLAMKINRKSSKSQLSLLPNSGSLSSLHETALTSDAEEVRSSVSAYQPVSSYTKRSSKR